MRKILLFLLAFASLSSAQILTPISFAPTAAAPSKGVVQGCVAPTLAGAQTAISCTFASNITAGHTLVLCMVNIGPRTLAWTGDSNLGSLVTVIANYQFDTVNQVYANCIYLLSAGGGATTITATSLLDYPSMFGLELSGTTSFDVFAQSAANQTGAGPFNSASGTTTSNGDLLTAITYYGGGGGNTFSAGTNVSWSLVASATSNSNGNAAESYVQPTAGSVFGSFGATLSGQPWWTVFFSWK